MSIEYTFPIQSRPEASQWSGSGDILTDTAKLDVIRGLFDRHRIMLVEHRHYYGSRARDLVVVEAFDEFLEYLRENALAGDLIYVFDITEKVEESKQAVVHGKCPDENGEIPSGGAY